MRKSLLMHSTTRIKRCDSIKANYGYTHKKYAFSTNTNSPYKPRTLQMRTAAPNLAQGRGKDRAETIKKHGKSRFPYTALNKDVSDVFIHERVHTHVNANKKLERNRNSRRIVYKCTLNHGHVLTHQSKHTP